MKRALTFDDVQIVPRYSTIKSRADCDLTTRFTKNFSIDLPYISTPMDTITEERMSCKMLELGGVGCLHRFMSNEEQLNKIKYINTFNQINNTDRPICAAIGLKVTSRHLSHLITAGVNIFLIDVAHGNTEFVKQLIKRLKKRFQNVDIIAGNVVTYEGAENLCEWGADAIRTGLGNGMTCQTRSKTGIGVPQITAIYDCAKAAERYDIPIIADGGIRCPGDVAKAIAAGADTVMLGSVLAGTKETPGAIQRTGIWPREDLFKKYRGSSSLEVKRQNNLDEKNVEGDSILVKYTGKVERIINDLNDGLRSAMSYVGADNIEEFRARSELIEITQSGMVEAKPHLKL